jgi:hypothetical protein
MKAYGVVDVQIHIFLTSALIGGEWSVSRSCRFTPGERASGIHGWTPSVVQPVASRYTDYAIPAAIRTHYTCYNQHVI